VVKFAEKAESDLSRHKVFKMLLAKGRIAKDPITMLSR
jgi:hypothetical protein